jgi:hypothetical protein
MSTETIPPTSEQTEGDASNDMSAHDAAPGAVSDGLRDGLISKGNAQSIARAVDPVIDEQGPADIASVSINAGAPDSCLYPVGVHVAEVGQVGGIEAQRTLITERDEARREL